MKRKLLGFLLAVLMVVSVLALSGCNFLNPEHEHDWSDWETIIPSTCQTPGTTERYCDCGESQTKSISVTDHVESDWIIDKEATCIEEGSRYKECTVCKKELIRESIPKTDHAYGEWIDEVPATTESEGTLGHYHCTVCGKNFDAEKNELESIVIPKLDDDEPVIPPHEHTEGEWIVDEEATCTRKGFKHTECVGCGLQIEFAIIETNPDAHTYDDKYDPFCNECGHEREVNAPCDHLSTVVIFGYAATCTENGLTDGKICSDCDKTVETQKTIPAKGHSFSTKWIKDEEYHWHGATCGHNDVISDKNKHNYDTDGECIVCEYQQTVKLETPVINYVLYDVVYWTEVKNAKNYTITVNEDYTYTTSSLSASISNAMYEGGYITTIGTVRIVVRANGDGQHYLDSDNSSVFNHYYVPEDTSTVPDKLYGYGIGYGYNLLEDEIIDLEEISHYRILNLSKLLTLGYYTCSPLAGGDFSGTRISSIEELELHLDASLDKNKGISIPLIGDLKHQLELGGGVDYTKYDFSDTYTVREDYFHEIHTFKDYDINVLEYCLTETFRNDIELAQSMNEDKWLEYMCSRYGTHAILGVVTGAYYNASYTVSTNRKDIAAKVNFEFGKNANVSISDILGLNLGWDFSLDANGKWSDEDTNANFTIDWKGSTGGGTTSQVGLDSALARFESGVAENAVPIKFTDKGAISIGSLISLIDDTLGQKFENYINSQADEKYQLLYSQYTKQPTFELQIENINGENVLTIDLFKYQSGGSIDNACNPNLRNGILTVYPKMMGKTVDKIVITGGLSEHPDSLINGFSIKLAKGWNKDIDIVVDNLGVICSYDKGLVDRSDVSSVYVIGLEYTGNNLIKYGDKTLFYASRNDKIYNFDLMLEDNETLDTSTIQIGSNIRLPITIKDGGYQFAGWYDTNGSAVTDNKGYILDDYVIIGAIAHISPKYIKASEGLEYTINDDYASYSVTGIGSCTDKDITIPDTYNGLSVTKIGNNAFKGLNSIKSVSISNSVTSIGDGAFADCTSLESVVIGDSVTTIGNYAFYYCRSLKDVYISDVKAWLNIEFCNDFSYPTISGAALHILDGNGNEVTNLIIPDGVTNIPIRAFFGCYNLTSITMPDSVTTIGDYAFAFCLSLTNITISDNVTTIGDDPFAFCLSLTSVTVDENNKYYKHIDGNLYTKDEKTLVQYALGKKSTSFVIPDNVTTIGNMAFYYCSNLESVVIGDSVTSIGSFAFDSCFSLAEVYYNGSAEDWNSISIDSYNDYLENATRYYYSENQPTEEGNFWHWVDGEPTVWQ